jgi:hypothetical protein
MLGRGVGWWIGDWLRFGNAAYGERYRPATRITGYDRQTLMNLVYVASRIEPERRRERLSWSHHSEVAAFEPADQDGWLDRAERDRLSVRCLREAIRGERLVAPERQRSRERRAEPQALCASCGRSIESPAERQSA